MIDVETLSPSLKQALTPKAQAVFVNAYNSAYKEAGQAVATQAAFAALKDQLQRLQPAGLWPVRSTGGDDA